MVTLEDKESRNYDMVVDCSRKESRPLPMVGDD